MIQVINTVAAVKQNSFGFNSNYNSAKKAIAKNVGLFFK